MIYKNNLYQDSRNRLIELNAKPRQQHQHKYDCKYCDKNTNNNNNGCDNICKYNSNNETANKNNNDIALKKESEKIIYNKYFEAFNFYFAKPINEIIAGISVSHVILFKDCLYYDDTHEYLKRSYNYQEIMPRIVNLCEFYVKSGCNESKPNLFIHDQNKIIQKRNIKMHKLFLSKLQNYNNIPQTHRKIQYENDDIGNNNIEKKDIEFKVLASNLNYDESSKPSYLKDNITSNLKSAMHDGSFKIMLDRYEKNLFKLTYETKIHDIYNPSFSSEREIYDFKYTSSIPNFIPDYQMNELDHNDILHNNNGEVDKSISILKNSQIEIQDEKIFDESRQDNQSEIIFLNEIAKLENKKISQSKEISPRIKNTIQNFSLNKPKLTENFPVHQTKPSIVLDIKKPQEVEIPSGNKLNNKEIQKSNNFESIKNDNFKSPKNQDKTQKIAKNNFSPEHQHPINPKKKFHSLKQPKENITECFSQGYSGQNQNVGANKPSFDIRKIGQNPNSISGNNNNQKFYDNFNTLQYIKELVQKHQRFSDEFLNGKSKMLNEEQIKNKHLTKMTSSEKISEKPQKIKEDYNNNEIHKKYEKNSYLARSKTEDGLFQQMELDKLKNYPASPLKVIEEKVLTQENQKKVLFTPNNQKIKQNRILSNDGVPNAINTLSGFNLMAKNSYENSRSIDHPMETKISRIKRIEGPQEKRKLKQRAYINSYSNNINITPQPQIVQSLAVSQQLISNKSLPVSPNHKSETKLTLNKLSNSQKIQQVEDNLTDSNSYGFWTSRSSRGLPEEYSTNRHIFDANNDYFLKNKYGLTDNIINEKRPQTKTNSASLTRSHQQHSDYKYNKDMGILGNKNPNGPLSKPVNITNQYLVEKESIGNPMVLINTANKVNIKQSRK